MSEWWTYRLSDFLLFSPETYHRLFELYNDAVWPAHAVALTGGVAIAAMLWRYRAWTGRVVLLLLAVAWLWVAWAYHYLQYATINWAAPSLAAGFAAEAALLLCLAALGTMRIPARGTRANIGLGLVIFAVVTQPLVGPLVGRSWTQVEIVGVAPDPTVVATLGALVALTGRFGWLLLPIPVAWCMISGATAWTMESPDAWLMPLAALLALGALLLRQRPAAVAEGE